MRLVLDACVIYPTVTREILVGCAVAGVFEPVWSARIIEEWLRATEKLGPDARPIAMAEAALMADQLPGAMCLPKPMDDLWLPDTNDIHVLEAALTANADGILTANTKDFPLRILSAHGVQRLHPDTFLLTKAKGADDVARVVDTVRQKAIAISGRPQPVRALLKRAGLPRLGKFLDQASDQPASN